MANRLVDVNIEQSVVYKDNQVSLYEPQSSIARNTVYVRPGDVINFNFEIKDTRVEVINGDLHIVFPNGSTMTLLSLATMGFSDTAPLLRDLQGNLMSVTEFLNKAYTLVYNNAYLILANKDDYTMSAERPNEVISASESTDILDGGNPVSGEGLSEVLLNGIITNEVTKGLVNSNKPNNGVGLFPDNNRFTDNPFLESLSNTFPGTIDEDSRPSLAYKIFYGVDLSRKAPVSLTINTGSLLSQTYNSFYSIAQGLDDTDDKLTLLANAELNLSSLTDNVMILSSIDYMVYVMEVSYKSGTTPNYMAIRIPGNDFTIEGDVKLENGAYVFNNVSPSGSMQFLLKFPYGLSPKNVDITYEISYVDRITGDTKYTSYIQPVKVVAVSQESDLGTASDFILANGSPGISVTTGTGEDILFGGYADNKIISGIGNDSVFTGGSNDVTDLGAGDDSYWASLGVDRIQGGAGKDTAYYNNFANKIPELDATGNILLDADGKIVYKVGNLLDITGNTIKDSYYNTYSPSVSLVFFLGAQNIATMLDTKALEDRYGTFDVLSYINNSTVLVAKEGSLSEGKTNVFDLYSGVEVFYGTKNFSDQVVLAYNSSTVYSDYLFYAGEGNANSRDAVIIDSTFNDAAGVLFDMNRMDNTNKTVFVGFGASVATNGSVAFSGFSVFNASAVDDKFKGGLGFNTKTGVNYAVYGIDADSDYQATGVGDGFTINSGLGNDTIDYSEDNRILYITFNAESSSVFKYYNATGVNAAGASKTIVVAQKDTLVYRRLVDGRIEQMNNIIGTNFADTYIGSLRNHYNYLSNATSSGLQDSLTYMGQVGAGMTLVLNADGTSTAYKTKLDEVDDITGFNTFVTANGEAFDLIGSNIRITLSVNSDVIVSNEALDYEFVTNINAGFSASTKDYISYVNSTGGISLDLANNGSVIVTKTGGKTDTFNFYNLTNNTVEIYGIYGSSFADTFLLNSGRSGENHYIFGAEGTDTISYANPAVTSVNIFLGATNRVEKATGAIDFFASIENIIGSAGADRVIITNTATIASLNSINIDLGAGRDVIDFSSASTDLLDSAGIEVNFASVTSLTVTINSGALTFANTEGVIGSSNDDTFIIAAIMVNTSLIFDGFAGEDVIDYSDFTTNVYFDLDVRLIYKGSQTDSIANIESFIGGTADNTFVSVLLGNYVFDASKGAVGKIQILDYSKIASGVVFDIDNSIVYKVNYASAEYTTALADGTLNTLRRDTYSGITRVIGSLGNDSFIISEANVARFSYEGGGGDYDIIDFSRFANGITLTLNETEAYTLAVTSNSVVYNVAINKIYGIKGTVFADTISLDGFRGFYVDGNTGGGTVSYVTTSSLVATGTAVSVRMEAQSMLVTKSYFVSSVTTILQDILKNIDTINLTDKEDEVAVSVWNTSSVTFDGKLGNDSLSFLDLIVGSDTQINVNIGQTLATFVVTNSILGGSITLQNFESISSAQNANILVNFVINDLNNIVNGMGIYGRDTQLSRTQLNFDATVFTEGLTLDLAKLNASFNTNSSITFKGTEKFITISNIKDINLTAFDDEVFAFQNQSVNFNGLAGDNTLSYENANFNTSGVIFYWKEIAGAAGGNTMTGYAAKNKAYATDGSGDFGSVRDSFVNFTNLRGSKLADVVLIKDFAIINKLLTANPSLNLNLFGADFGNDTIQLDFTTSITYNLSTGSILSGTDTIDLSWISSVNGAGVANDLILEFGSGDDTLIFSGSLTGNYSIINGSSGTNTFNASTSTVGVAFRAVDGVIALNEAALSTSPYSIINFSKIIGAAVGKNVFIGTTSNVLFGYKGIQYTGSGLNGVNSDFLSYITSISALTINFTSATGGEVGLTSQFGISGATTDTFSNIFGFRGGQGSNTFRFNDTSIAALDKLQLFGGASQDFLLFDFAVSSSITITSSDLSVTLTGGTAQTLDLTAANSIETIQLNTSTKDWVNVGQGVDFSMFIRGSDLSELDADRKDVLTYSSSIVITSANSIYLGGFNTTTGVSYSLIFDSRIDVVERQVGSNIRTDYIRGFSEINYSGNGRFLAIGSIRDYTFKGAVVNPGASEFYNLHVDYSRANFGTQVYFLFTDFNAVKVTKDLSGGTTSTDILSNVGYIMGSSGNDTFVLTTRPASISAVITLNGGAGTNTVSLDQLRNTLGTIPGGDGSLAAGSLGNEYVLIFTGGSTPTLSLVGYNLININTYGITEVSDAFIAPASSTLSFSVNGLGGIDLLDYSAIASTWNIRLDYVLERVSKYRFVGSNIEDGIADKVINFERGKTGGGDDVFTVNEKQVFLATGTTNLNLGTSLFLFDSGAGYNTLNLDNVDATKYSLDLSFYRSGGNNLLQIIAKRTSDSVTTTSLSKGFSVIDVGYGNLQYTYDASHIAPIAYGNANPITSSSSGMLQFISLGKNTTTLLDSTFTFVSSTAITVSIELTSLLRDMKVFNKAASANQFISLQGFTKVVMSGSNVLNLTTVLESQMTFIGGNTGNDKADFSTSSVTGESKIEISAIAGTTSTIKYTSQVNLSGITLQNVENIISATGANTTIVIKERIGFNNATDYTISITAGVGRTNTVSFETFTTALTGFNAAGYNLVNFTNYKLTALADTFVVADSTSFVIDALGSADYATVKDKITFLNSSSAAYTNAISISQFNNIMYVSKKSATNANYQDELKNFEIFVLTAHDDTFIAVTNTVTGLTAPSYVEIDFGAGTDKADLSTYTYTGLIRTEITVTSAEMNINLFHHPASGPANPTDVDLVFTNYVFKNLEELYLKDNNVLNFSGAFTSSKISVLGSNNQFNYSEPSAFTDVTYAYIIDNSATYAKFYKDSTAVHPTTAVEITGITNYNIINTARLFRFDNFSDFSKNYFLMNTYNSKSIRTVLNYSSFSLSPLTVTIGATSVAITNSTIGIGVHTTMVHNIILSARDDNIKINTIYSHVDGTTPGTDLNIGASTTTSNVTFTTTASINAKYYKIFDNGTTSVSTIFSLNLGTTNVGDQAFASTNIVVRYYILDYTDENKIAKVGDAINLYYVKNFVDTTGRVIVNYNLGITSYTDSYIVGGKDNTLNLSGAVTADINLDLTTSTLYYKSAVTGGDFKSVIIKGFNTITATGNTTYGLNVTLNATYGTLAQSLLLVGSANSTKDTITLTDGVEMYFPGGGNRVGAIFLAPATQTRFELVNFNTFIFSVKQDSISLDHEFLKEKVSINGNGGGDTLFLSSIKAISSVANVNGISMQMLGASATNPSATYLGTSSLGVSNLYALSTDYLTIRGIETINFTSITSSTSKILLNINVAFSIAYSGIVKTININPDNSDGFTTSFTLLSSVSGVVQTNTSARYGSKIGVTLDMNNANLGKLTYVGKSLNINGFNTVSLSSVSDIVNFTLIKAVGNSNNTMLKINPSSDSKLSGNSSINLATTAASGFSNNDILGMLTTVGNSSRVSGGYGDVVTSIAYNNSAGNNKLYSIYSSGFNSYTYNIVNTSHLTNNVTTLSSGAFSGYNTQGVAGVSMTSALGYTLGSSILSGINVVFATPLYKDSNSNFVSYYNFTSNAADKSSFYIYPDETKVTVKSMGTVTFSGKQILISDLLVKDNASGSNVSYNVNLVGFSKIYFGITPDYNGGLIASSNPFVVNIKFNNPSFGLEYNTSVYVPLISAGNVNIYYSNSSLNGILGLRNKADSIDLGGIPDNVNASFVFTLPNSKLIKADIKVLGNSYIAANPYTLTSYNFDRFVGVQGGNNTFDITGLQTSALTSFEFPLFIQGGGMVGFPGSNTNDIIVRGNVGSGVGNLFLSTGIIGFNAFQLGNTATGQRIAIVFEGIQRIRYNGATREIISKELAVDTIIADNNVDDEFTINSMPNDFVMNGNGGNDTYYLHNDIVFSLEKGNVIILNGVEYFTSGYYMVITDAFGDVGYIINIADAKFEQNGVAFTIEDLLSGFDATLISKGVEKIVYLDNQEESENLDIENDNTDNIAVNTNEEGEVIAENLEQNALDNNNIDENNQNNVDFENITVLVNTETDDNINDADLYNLASNSTEKLEENTAVNVEEIDMQDTASLDNLLDGLLGSNTTNLQDNDINNELLDNIDSANLLDTTNVSEDDYAVNIEENADIITDMQKALHKNTTVSNT